MTRHGSPWSSAGRIPAPAAARWILCHGHPWRSPRYHLALLRSGVVLRATTPRRAPEPPLCIIPCMALGRLRPHIVDRYGRHDQSPPPATTETEWSIFASAVSTPRQLGVARSGGEDPGKRGAAGGNRWRPGFTGRGSEEDGMSDTTPALDEAFERMAAASLSCQTASSTTGRWPARRWPCSTAPVTSTAGRAGSPGRAGHRSTRWRRPGSSGGTRSVTTVGSLSGSATSRRPLTATAGARWSRRGCRG